MAKHSLVFHEPRKTLKLKDGRSRQLRINAFKENRTNSWDFRNFRNTTLLRSIEDATYVSDTIKTESISSCFTMLTELLLEFKTQ